MKRYQFVVNITAEGVAFRSGDVVGRDEIPNACFESLLRTGACVEVVEPSKVSKPAEPTKQTK